MICSSSCALNFDDFRFFSSSIAHLEPDLEQFENRLIFPAAIMFHDAKSGFCMQKTKLRLLTLLNLAPKAHNLTEHFSIENMVTN